MSICLMLWKEYFQWLLTLLDDLSYENPQLLHSKVSLNVCLF